MDMLASLRPVLASVTKKLSRAAILTPLFFLPIELKIANKGWSGSKLRERLENQLVGQYMRSSTCGVFLLIKNCEKRWQEPGTRKRMDFNELLAWLQREANTLSQKYPNVTSLRVVGIDLTLRLPNTSGST